MRCFVLAVAISLLLVGCTRRAETTPASAEPSSGVAPRKQKGATGMDFFDVIASRRSVREFSQERVSDAVVDRLLAAANRAPSAGNLQAYEIVVVRSAKGRRVLARAALGQDFVAEAPLVLVFVTHPERNAERYGERGARLYSLQDATIAAAYAQLAAQALGLGSVWVGAFDEESVLLAVRAPKGHGVSSLLVVGHAARLPEATPRRSVDDLAHDETLR